MNIVDFNDFNYSADYCIVKPKSFSVMAYEKYGDEKIEWSREARIFPDMEAQPFLLEALPFELQNHIFSFIVSEDGHLLQKI